MSDNPLVECPEHKRLCVYNPRHDTYTCIYSPTRSVASMCGWSVNGSEAYKFIRVDKASSETTNDSANTTV